MNSRAHPHRSPFDQEEACLRDQKNIGKSFHAPKLLVSIRSAAELRRCMDVINGQRPADAIDILDLKEPNLGSIGRCAADDVIDCANLWLGATDKPWTVAAGDTVDLLTSDGLNWLAQFAALIAVDPDRCLGIKVGFNPDAQGITGHFSQLNAVWPKRINLIPVFYADKQVETDSLLMDWCEHWLSLAETFSPKRWLTIDTAEKGAGKTLADLLSPSLLAAMVDWANAHQVKLTLAGSLQTHRLSEFTHRLPAAIGVRGAVCDRYDRKSAIEPAQLLEFAASWQLLFREHQYETASRHHP